jgi:hypothetical protein
MASLLADLLELQAEHQLVVLVEHAGHQEVHEEHHLEVRVEVLNIKN